MGTARQNISMVGCCRLPFGTASRSVRVLLKVPYLHYFSPLPRPSLDEKTRTITVPVVVPASRSNAWLRSEYALHGNNVDPNRQVACKIGSNVQKSHDIRAPGAWCPRLWSPRHRPDLRSPMGMVGGSSARGRARVLPGLTDLLDGRSGRNGVSSKEEIELSGRDLSKGLDPLDKYARQTTLNRSGFSARITRNPELMRRRFSAGRTIYL